jgi:hypothetical protein
MTITVQDRGRIIRADYEGGPYIELSFNTYAYRPVEVINVWDYETGKPQIANTEEAVKAQVREWINTQNEEWPEWFEGYRRMG